MAEVLVLGAGVIGLTTAVTLQERGHRVRIWAAEPPAATTSAVAAAIWYPFLAEPRDRVLGWSRTTFARLRQLAADPATGVRMTAVRELFATAAPDLWWLPAVAGCRRVPATELAEPWRAAIDLEVPLGDTRRYLPWLLERFRAGGGRFELRRVDHLDTALAAAPEVVNCTGLGSRTLCADAELQPVRGQVLRLTGVPVARALIDDSGSRPCYVLPRGDEVVGGGTAQPGDERLAADPADSAAILAMACRHQPDLHGARVLGAAVGLRPCRRTVRLERDPDHPGQLLHNYGHGGSGFTLAWGCADEVAGLLRP